MKKIAIFLLLLITIGGYAQHKTLRFYHLTVENGLPKRTPTAVLQDKYGYIWAGTSAGLVRYDGYHVKVYLTNLGIGFLSGVSYLYEDHEGKLWVGTNNKGLFRYDRATDTFRQPVYFSSDSAANFVVAIQEDGSENIWSISSSANKYFLNCFNKKTGRWQHFSHNDSGAHHLDATQFYSLAKDHSGHIWMATNNGLYEYDSATNHFKGYRIAGKTLHTPGRYFFFIPSSQPGMLWMDDDAVPDTGRNQNPLPNGLICFNTNDHTFKTYQHDPDDSASIGSNVVLAALEDKDKRLWIGTQNGISLFNPHSGTFSNYNAVSTIVSGNGSCNLTQDTASNLWYSNPHKGLFYFNTKDKIFTNYPANPRDPKALQTNDIVNMFTDESGDLWLSELSGGLQWVDKTASLFTIYPKNNEENAYSYGKVNDYAEDSKGNIWLATNTGLVYWNRLNDFFKPVKITYPDYKKTVHNVSCITIDKSGMMWYGDGNYGLFRYDPVNRLFKHYLLDSSSLNAYDYIECIYEDREGKIWAGTALKGLYSVDPQNDKITHFAYAAMELTRSQPFKERRTFFCYDIFYI